MVKRGIPGGVFRPLSCSDIEAIHGASLEVLERVGLQVKSRVIVEVFKKGGANVDEVSNAVRIPEYLVKDSLSKAPRKVVLGGRIEANDLVLEDGRAYFGLGGTPTPYTLDVESGDLRPSTGDDVVKASVLGDALPNICHVARWSVRCAS